MQLNKIAIVGVGLIGGSVALAMRAAQPDVRLIGVDRDDANLDAALRRGVVDEAVELADIGDVDLVLLAVPVRQMPALLLQLGRQLAAETIITDASSTKQSVIAEARAGLGSRIGQFVPGHPIAGREHSGVAAAASELFDGKNVVLTPLEENSAAAVELVRSLWRACGANVMEMSAAEHDAVFAAVSHLPHLLAFALVDELAGRPNAKSLFSFAASGFRDFTRIASSSPEMWRDIALDNRAALVREFDHYLSRAQALRDAVARGDAGEIEALMARAREARNHWLAGQFDYFKDESA